jgi:FkbM family methyltransferase
MKLSCDYAVILLTILECGVRGLPNLQKTYVALEASTTHSNLLSVRNVSSKARTPGDGRGQHNERTEVKSVASVGKKDDASLKTAEAIKEEWKVNKPDFAVPALDINDLDPNINLTMYQQGVTKIAVQYIKTPAPQRLVDMHPDTAGMFLGHLPVPGNEGTKIDIYCYPPSVDKYVSGSIIDSGTWECESVADCAQPWLANPSLKGNFLDLGGNIGAYTLPLGRFLQGKGEVISVEGMPDIAEHLQAGIVANKLSNVNLFQYCLGAPDAADYLKMNLNPFNKGGSHLDGNKHPDEGHRGISNLKGVLEAWNFVDTSASQQGTKVNVSVTTLDAMLEVLPALKSVVVMKSDIEGNEGRMLKGAHKFFTKHPPCYLQFELHHDWLKSAGTPYDEVLQMLTKFGYKMIRHDAASNYWFEQQDMASCLKRFT